MAIECLNDDRNVTYDSEGMWRCTARNTIKGHERVTQLRGCLRAPSASPNGGGA